MKNFSKVLLASSFAACSLLAVSCGSEAEVKVDSVEYRGINESYYSDSTINFDSVELDVTYSDGSQKTLTKGEALNKSEFSEDDLDSIRRNTEFILYTNGLDGQSPVVGTYTIQYYIIGESDNLEDLCEVEVKKPTVTSVAAKSGLYTSYFSDETIDFSKINLEVTYNTGKTKILTNGLVVGNTDPATIPDGTEFIIYTNNLNPASPTVGSHQIDYRIIGETVEKAKLADIEIKAPAAIDYDKTEVEGVELTYIQGQDVNFDGVKLTLTYTDNSTRELTKCEVNTPIGEVKAKTEFVFYICDENGDVVADFAEEVSAGTYTITAPAGAYKIKYQIVGETEINEFPAQLTVAAEEISSVNYVGQASFTESYPIDLSDVKLALTYNNGKTKTLTKHEIDVVTPAEETEFVIYTNGINLENPTAGNYTLKYKIVGETTEREKAVTVSSYTQSTDYYLTSFGAPTRTLADDTSTSDDKEKESLFYAIDETYQIGDDNEFIFKPVYKLQPRNSQPAGVNLKTVAEVYLWGDYDNNAETPDTMSETPADETYYTYNPSTYGFNFTQAAVGKKFTLNVKPADFSKFLNGSAIAPATFNIEVQDGYNVYSALDLGIMNVNNLKTWSDYNGNVPTKDGNYTEWENYAGAYMRYQNDGIHMYYAGNNTWEAKSNDTLWTNFLKSKGYDLSAIEDTSNGYNGGVNGIFVHNNIDVTVDDIPAEMFIYESEVTADQTNAIGSLRDFAVLYQHFSTEGNDFLFNGNHFTINFEGIPFSMSKSPDDTSGNIQIFTNSNPAYFAAHAAAFEFCGKRDFTTTAKATIKNVNFVGNTGGVVNVEYDNKGNIVSREPLAAGGGLIQLKAVGCETNVDNALSKNFMISWYAEDESTLNMNHVKTYDGFNSGIFSWRGEGSVSSTSPLGGVAVTNSEFKRFGGPIAFLISNANTKAPANAYNAYPALHSASINFTNTVLENFVKGTEAWFALNPGSTGAATALKVLDSSIYTKTSSTILYNNEFGNNVLNLITVAMDGDYMSSTAGMSYTSVTIDGKDYVDYGTNYANVASLKGMPYIETAGGQKDFGVPTTNDPNDLEATLGSMNPLKADNVLYKASLGQNPDASDFETSTYTGDYTHIIFHLGSTPLGIVLGMSEVSGS